MSIFSVIVYGFFPLAVLSFLFIGFFLGRKIYQKKLKIYEMRNSNFQSMEFHRDLIHATDKNHKECYKDIYNCVAVYMLSRIPHNILWCIIDDQKRVIATHSAFSKLYNNKQRYNRTYLLHLLRSAQVEEGVESAFNQKLLVVLDKILLFEQTWNVFIQPYKTDEILDTIDRASLQYEKSHSKLPRAVALITCFPENFYKNSEEKQEEEEFLQNIAHEIRNPLTSIIGFSHILKSHDTVQHDIIQRIQKQSERINTIVDNIMLLAQNDKEKVHFDSLCINTIIHNVIINFDSQCKQKSIVINVYNPSNTEFQVVGNENLLSIAFKNIIENAIRYSYSNACIDITFDICKEPYVSIKVKDMGIGITHMQQEKIFDRFYRTDYARSRSKGGAGIGLAITKKIITLHEGSITVNSNINKGSTFTVVLPIVV